MLSAKRCDKWMANLNRKDLSQQRIIESALTISFRLVGEPFLYFLALIQRLLVQVNITSISEIIIS